MISFNKYHGTGNDFILIDDREQLFPAGMELIREMCTRRFGIGADGLILLQNSTTSGFRMIYFNADGNEGSLCGNGSRCAVAFAKETGMVEQRMLTFEASDGIHSAIIENGLVRLQMNDVKKIEACNPDYFLNTGSPHYVKMLQESPDSIDVVQEGRQIRFSSRFREEGTNVNFVQQTGTNEIRVRTYERGVEDETFSCGTGVVAAAIAALHDRVQASSKEEIRVLTKGGELKVNFTKGKDGYHDIWLTGPATKVYSGEYGGGH
ncbi:MAG: diaminopimelate epimerase [Bacteroidia bacterium]